jgi:hypothetical protein
MRRVHRQTRVLALLPNTFPHFIKIKHSLPSSPDPATCISMQLTQSKASQPNLRYILILSSQTPCLKALFLLSDFVANNLCGCLSHPSNPCYIPVQSPSWLLLPYGKQQAVLSSLLLPRCRYEHPLQHPRTPVLPYHCRAQYRLLDKFCFPS